MKNGHTPIPWRTGSLESYSAYTGEREMFIYRLPPDDPAETAHTRICVRGPNCVADADFIINADNHTALIAALENAKEIIRIYYGMKCLPGHDEAERWRLYQASPEMKRINEALAKARQ